MQIPAVRGRVVAAEIRPQHIGDRQAELAARRRVADHGRDDVSSPLQCVHGPHGRGLLPGREPGLGEDPRAHPPLELDVVETGAQQTGVEAELCVNGKAGDDGGALGILLEGLAKRAHERGVGVPIDVLGWIERREALYFSFSLIFERNPPSPAPPPPPPPRPTPASAAAKSRAVS